MTLATDYVLAALGFYLGLRLWRQADRSGAIQRWALAFWATALAALAGGTAHGFAEALGDGLLKAAVWKAVVFSIGAASFLFLTGTAQALCPPGAARVVHTVALAKLGLYCLWMISHDDFLYVIADYAPSLAFVAGIGLWAHRRDGVAAGRRIALGVVVSFSAALVQMSGFAPHRHFNHNDLYHVIQMLGLVILYSGAKDLPASRQERRMTASM